MHFYQEIGIRYESKWFTPPHSGEQSGATETNHTLSQLWPACHPNSED